MSGYFLWLNENRESIKEENPGISVTDISKKAGEMWRGITDKTVSKVSHTKGAFTNDVIFFWAITWLLNDKTVGI